MAINERLKAFIMLTCPNLTEFAKKTGIPYSSLQNYLRGVYEPTLGNLQKIVDKFNLNIHWLLTGEGSPFTEKGKQQSSLDAKTQDILRLIRDMNEEQQKEILKYIEEKRLLMELMAERRRKK
jgi:transcriptional regulator with XRE-family HTH domain